MVFLCTECSEYCNNNDARQPLLNEHNKHQKIAHFKHHKLELENERNILLNTPGTEKSILLIEKSLSQLDTQIKQLEDCLPCKYVQHDMSRIRPKRKSVRKSRKRGVKKSGAKSRSSLRLSKA